jgi:hypothetical protein
MEVLLYVEGLDRQVLCTLYWRRRSISQPTLPRSADQEV